MKIKKSYLAILVVIAVIGGGYYWYRKSQSSSSQVQYVTATAEKGTLISSISASGNIIVDQIANVDPTISGTVSNLAVNVGEQVEKGQLLFDIVNNDLRVNVEKSDASYQSAKSSLESAEASEKQADADLSSAKHKNKVTPGSYTKRQIAAMEEKLDAAGKSVDAAEQSLTAALADLQNQQDNASERQVVSPISGTVSEVNIKNGDDLAKVSTGSARVTPIIIGDLNTLKARVQVNEVDIPNVSIGQKATLTFDAISGFTATGKVEKMDSLGTITQNVVTYNVTIGFDTLDPRIKPEMSVAASIITIVKQDVIIVPNSAVKFQDNNNYVEILQGQTPAQVNVEIGATNNTDTEIVSGLKEGDQVITQTINSNSNANANTNSSNRGGGSFRIPGLGGGGPRD
ncbi:MAG: efflux RND transporter periplasmic adaptor subunit [Candidatus Moraniibacteriota bacterium]